MNAKVYVDGSYNSETCTGGAAYIMLIEDKPPIYWKACIVDANILKQRNVGCELIAAFEALKEAKRKHVDQLDIFYDYEGIEKFANGTWTPKNYFTKWYVNQYCIAETYMDIYFHKVLAHSGEEWNEKVDRLAKEGCLMGGI